MLWQVLCGLCLWPRVQVVRQLALQILRVCIEVVREVICLLQPAPL